MGSGSATGIDCWTRGTLTSLTTGPAGTKNPATSFESRARHQNVHFVRWDNATGGGNKPSTTTVAHSMDYCINATTTPSEEELSPRVQIDNLCGSVNQ